MAGLEPSSDDEFGLICHELKTPLTSARLAAYLLLDGIEGPLSGAQSQLLQTIRADLDRQLEMIDTLLQIKHLETGQTALVSEPIDLRRLVAQVIADQRPEAEAKQLKLCLKSPENPFKLVADPQRIRLALRHLLDNAIQFSPKGGCITLSIDGEGDGLTCTVQDDGPGVDPVIEETLFEKFSRSRPSGGAGLDLGLGLGLGLGLSLARQIALSHGGTLTHEPPESGGARFVLKLPKKALPA